MRVAVAVQCASLLDRSSGVGRAILDQLSCTLRRLCSVFGTAFTVHAAKVLFKSTLGLSLFGAAGAVSPHDDDPTRNQKLLKKVLFDTGDAVVRGGGSRGGACPIPL